MMFRHSVITLALALAAFCAVAKTPTWLEADSAAAIQQRIRGDFSLSEKEGRARIAKLYPWMTPAGIDSCIALGYAETKTIDGKRMMFRKSPTNVALLHPSMAQRKGRLATASPERLRYVEQAVDSAHARRYRLHMTLRVPYDKVLKGDTLHAWLPYPMNTQRQKDVRLVATSQPDYVISTPEQSMHHSIYMQQPVLEGDTAVFSYTVDYLGLSEYVSPEEIAIRLQPYNKGSKLYKQYTAFEAPHIVNLKALADSIADGETNPFILSEKVYDYIAERYPWAGAREYSTIECIPEYVLREGHGDCGQVSLLYISLMRSLGIPARWESGWMLHPGEKNLHDWAEVYFEGIGWVPVDMSFGRYTNAKRPEVRNFYSHGMDAYRMAANKGVGGQFFPPKQYVRSETVDAQMGEVECSKGNLFYPAFDTSMEILEAVDTVIPHPRWALTRLTSAHGRYSPEHAGEMATQAVMGMPVRLIEKDGEDGDWWKVQTPDGYESYIIASSLVPKTDAEMAAWRNAPRLIVTAPYQTRAYDSKDAAEDNPRAVVTDLVNGCIVEGRLNPRAERQEVTLPDGRRAWVDTKDVVTLDQWAAQPFNPEKILNQAYSTMGTPYLWGGNTVKATDCSGLSKLSYYSNGIILQRDASQQARTGEKVDPSDWHNLQQGDLLFVGNPRTGRVTHVMIYDRDGYYVHSSKLVRRNSLDPSSPDYQPDYHILSASRMHGDKSSPGIVRAEDHPWYF